MSVRTANSPTSEWTSFRNRSQSSAGFNGGHLDHLGITYGRIQTSTVEVRPPLRSHRSYPYTLGSSTHQSSTHCQSPLSQVANPGANDNYETSFGNEPKESEISARVKIEPSYDASAPNSPMSRLSPTSADAEQDSQQEDDYDGPTTCEEAEDDGVDGGVPKTAAERRAEKRKMKRFRLTHNQTRFLMSEFARQAHPDAAQRERLSREIPGLSPRQVQVWFQNRRAKLKRLTSDDRERMMKSRALPEDFDMTQALHSPFGAAMPQTFSVNTYSTPAASPSSYSSTFNESVAGRALMIDGLRRPSDDESNISPISLSTNFGNFYTPPGSMPGSENLSPISPASERANFMSSSFSTTGGSRNGNPFTRSSSFSANFHPHPHIPRLQLHDRVSRSRAESLGSPLRSSMSYTGNVHEYSSSPTTEAVPSQADPPRTYSVDTSTVSQVSGFSHIATAGFQSSALARPRPTITTFPPGLDLRTPYRSPHPFANFPQVQATQGFQSAPLSAPQDFQLPHPNSHAQGIYQTTTTQYTTVAFGGEPESYYKSEPYRRRIVEEPVVEEYAGDDSTAEQAGTSANGSEQVTNEGVGGLQPHFGGGRRRSFTLPMDFGTSH